VVHTTVVIDIIFWDTAPCSLHVNWRFGGTYHLHFQGRKSRWFLARLIFCPEDGGYTFLREVGSHMDYTALYLRRWQHLMKLNEKWWILCTRELEFGERGDHVPAPHTVEESEKLGDGLHPHTSGIKSFDFSTMLLDKCHSNCHWEIWRRQLQTSQFSLLSSHSWGHAVASFRSH
jgi:hypothetical protein